MDVEFRGWPPDGEAVQLDHRRFAYAGKFVMTQTAKAVATAGDTVVAAVAFDEDRTDPSCIRLRYVTVARGRQGEGIGPRIVASVRDRALEAGYDRVCIAVNNPYAYEALSRVGFHYTGETTGLAEVVLAFEQGTEPTVDDYRAGLERLAELPDRSEAERAYIENRLADHNRT